MNDTTKQRIIIDEVKNYLSVTEDDIQTKGRNRTKKVYPRQVAFWFCKKYTHLSLSDIGRAIGFKNHATVLHGIKTINNLIDTDTKVKNDIIKLKIIFENILTQPEPLNHAETKKNTTYATNRPINCRE